MSGPERKQEKSQFAVTSFLGGVLVENIFSFRDFDLQSAFHAHIFRWNGQDKLYFKFTSIRLLELIIFRMLLQIADGKRVDVSIFVFLFI